MGTLYIDTGGSANNSGSSDNNAADLSGTSATVSGTTVTLDAGTVLTGVVTSGASQSAINIAGATNTNQTIFWITGTAGSGGATPTVTVSVAPTGVTTNAWKIGGRHLLTNARIEGTPVAGDIVQFNNSPAAQTATVWSNRNSGTTSGFIKVIGKSGTRPILTTTGNNTPLTSNAQTNIHHENLEAQCQGATGAGCVNNGAGCQSYNLKVSDFGTGTGMTPQIGINCEITGGLGDGMSVGGLTLQYGCFVHDNAGNGANNTNNNSSAQLMFCIIVNNGARGIYWSGAPTTQGAKTLVINCTIYGNQNSGLDAANANASFVLLNTIFQDNGWNNSAYNVNFPTVDTLTSFHAWNVFYNSGALGGSNLNNVTANAFVAASEFTTDPLFTATGMGTFASTDVSTGSDTITITSHGLSANDKFMIHSTSSSVPTGLAVKTPYFVIVVDANTIKLCNNYNGSAIDITGTGSGTNRYSSSVKANFGIASTSPAKATGFPGQILGSTSIGYLDMGAVQRQEPSVETSTGRFN